MKKINVLFMMMFLLVGALSFVVAEEDVADEAVIKEAKNVGFFGNAMDGIRFAFTFNKERKIEFALERAEKRLAEVEANAEDNPERAERAQERYDEFVAKAEEILAAIEDRQNNEDESTEYIGKIARIQKKFELHREHAEEIYTRALIRFEENNASDEKIERFEMFYERSLSRSNEMEIKLIAKRRSIIERHKDLTNESDDELEDVLEEIEKREGLTAARIRREVRSKIRIEKFDEVTGRRIERYELRLEESDLSEEQELRIRARIETADGKRLEFRQRIEDGEVRTRIRIRDKSEDDNLDDDEEDDDDSNDEEEEDDDSNDEEDDDDDSNDDNSTDSN